MVRRIKKGPRRSRTAFGVIVLLTVGAFSVVWWIWPGLGTSSPRFYSILIEKNDQPLRFLDGETLRLHPKDRVRILDISTNIFFNIGVRLFASGLDVNALFSERLPIAGLLRHEAGPGEQAFKVIVKHHNQDIGFVDIVVAPFMEDWLAKAERMSEPDRRIEILEEALQLAPEDNRIRLRLVEEYKALKKWPQAAKMLETVANEKADPRVLSDLAEVYEGMSQTEKAISVLRKLLEMNPDDVKVRLRMATALEMAKKTQEAANEYEEIIKRVGKEDQLYLHKILGYLYADMRQIPNAVSSYTKALELDRNDANLYYNLSSLYEKEGNEEKSDFYLSEAVRLNPEDTEGPLKLSERLIQKGNLEDAQKYLTEVLNRTPDMIRALVLMSHIAEKRKDQAKQRELYNKILALDPSNENIAYNLGVLEYETGNDSKSILLLERFSIAHPEDVVVHALLFNMYRRDKRDEQAFREAQALVRLNPKERGLYPYLFEYLNTRSDYEGIIEVMKEGLKSLPENIDLLEYLVLAYLKTGKEGPALERMKEILKIQPNNVTLLLQMARLQEKQGKISEALGGYRKILEISPGHGEAEEAYLRLRLQGLPLERKDRP